MGRSTIASVGDGSQREHVGGADSAATTPQVHSVTLSLLSAQRLCATSLSSLLFSPLALLSSYQIGRHAQTTLNVCALARLSEYSLCPHFARRAQSLRGDGERLRNQVGRALDRPMDGRRTMDDGWWMVDCGIGWRACAGACNTGCELLILAQHSTSHRLSKLV